MGKRSSRKQKPSHKNHNSRPKNGQSQLARSFQPGGSDIFSCEPYVYTVSPQDAHLRCHCCLKLLPDAELRPTEFSCGSCKYFRYCGKECQNKDKLRHQNECALWKRIKDAGLVPNVTFILVLRAVLAMKDAGQENDWELLKFSDLLSHVEVLLKDEEEKALVTSTRKSLAKILKMTEKNLLDPDSFPELYGRIRFNAMAIYDTDVIQSLKGHGIYKHFAYLKHSCMPSACAIFEGVRLKVRAMKYVPDISKVTVSFVDQLLPRSCRCKILMEEYDCVCDCQRCSTPGTDAEMYALRCPRKNCSAVIPSDHRALTECVACGARLYDNSAYSSALILMAEFPLLKSQLAKRIGSVTGPENSYRVLCELNTAMEKYDVLHYNNPYFSALMLFMGNVYFKRHEYSQAAVWVEFALESYRKLLDANDPRVGMLLLKIAEARYLDSLLEGPRFVATSDKERFDLSAQEARRALEIAYGPDSPLVTKALKLVHASRTRLHPGRVNSSKDYSESEDDEECSCGRCSTSTKVEEEKNYKDFFDDRDFYARSMRQAN